jgi:transketolase
MEFVAVRDRFGRSGKPEELMAAFGIKAPDVVRAADLVLARKNTRR